MLTYHISIAARLWYLVSLLICPVGLTSKYWTLSSLSDTHDGMDFYLNCWGAFPVTLAIHYLLVCVVQYTCKIRINNTMTHATTFTICL